MKSRTAINLVALASFGIVARGADQVDFVKEIKPILEVQCVNCHGGEKPKGKLSLETRANAIKGGEDGAALVPGKPSDSPLYTFTILPADDDNAMPPKGERLTKDQTEKLRLWVAQGATWPESETLKAVKKIDFVKDVQPILEFNCVACHRDGHDEGSLRLDTKELAFKGGDSGPAIVPFKSAESPLYKLINLPPDHDDLMPPKKKGGPLPKEDIQTLKSWIDQGAVWPANIHLVPRKKEEVAQADTQLVQNVYEKIIAAMDVKDPSEMKPYKITIPGTKVTFEMVPIPGGEYTMGSPDSEPGHKPDESPQHKVKIDPFWMGKCEVTWDEYDLFMYPEEERKIRVLNKSDASLHTLADAVSRPTKPYVEMSFGMGKEGYPAISMTQHAANTYCKWLSAKLSQFYRLPTEAEWEYACRAGTTTAYSFGDDVSKLGEYAWYADNSNYKYQKVGTKKPNPWGLYDMHGNVVEWCLDQYVPDAYKQFEGAVADNPWLKSTKPYPQVVRGGSWDDDPAALRSAARRGSNPVWKVQDPQLPKSIWFHTDAQFLGFRLVRPFKIPAEDTIDKYWTSGVERD
jgi:formylglycine-generating enzyme required for sulfatase activity/mono/diheme cytochrome c family protein